MFAIPNFVSPYSASPLASGIEWISGMFFDFYSGQASIVLNANADLDSANAYCAPISQKKFILGQNGLPSLGEAIADNYLAFNAIAVYAYSKLAVIPPYSGVAQIIP